MCHCWIVLDLKMKHITRQGQASLSRLEKYFPKYLKMESNF